MKTYAISTLLVVLTFLAISCVHTPLGMQTGAILNASAPAAEAIASPQPDQEQHELDEKEQAALDEALLEAAWTGDIEGLASALVRGANIEAKAGYAGHTALHRAAQEGQLEVSQLLLERGANIDAQDRWGYTALRLATQKRRQQVVAVLNARLAKRELEALEELQSAPRDLNELIVNIGYGKEAE